MHFWNQEFRKNKLIKKEDLKLSSLVNNDWNKSHIEVNKRINNSVKGKKLSSSQSAGNLRLIHSSHNAVKTLKGVEEQTQLEAMELLKYKEDELKKYITSMTE